MGKWSWVCWCTLRDWWWMLSGEYVDDSDSRNWNFWFKRMMEGDCMNKEQKKTVDEAIDEFRDKVNCDDFCAWLLAYHFEEFMKLHSEYLGSSLMREEEKEEHTPDWKLLQNLSYYHDGILKEEMDRINLEDAQDGELSQSQRYR